MPFSFAWVGDDPRSTKGLYVTPSGDSTDSFEERHTTEFPVKAQAFAAYYGCFILDDREGVCWNPKYGWLCGRRNNIKKFQVRLTDGRVFPVDARGAGEIPEVLKRGRVDLNDVVAIAPDLSDSSWLGYGLEVFL